MREERDWLSTSSFERDLSEGISQEIENEGEMASVTFSKESLDDQTAAGLSWSCTSLVEINCIPIITQVHFVIDT